MNMHQICSYAPNYNTMAPVKNNCSKKLYMARRKIGSEFGGANRHSVGNVSGLASCQVWEAGSGHCGESSK